MIFSSVAEKLATSIVGLDAFPMCVDTVVGDAQRVTTRREEEWHFSTGEVLKLPVLCVHEIEDGKIKLWHEFWNMPAFMEQLPKSITVLGGGYIGIEMAQIMQAFGVKTTILARNKFLNHVDQELIEVLLESMQKLGLDARTKTPFTGVTKLDNGQLRVTLADGGHVRVSVGENDELVLNAEPVTRELEYLPEE